MNPETQPRPLFPNKEVIDTDSLLQREFSLFLAISGKRIKDVARETDINLHTLYNWRANGQKLSEKKVARLHAYMNSFPSNGLLRT